MIKTVVLYHSDCQDGFGAAFAAWTVLGDDALYIPVQYGKLPPPEALVAERLYILDFSYDAQTLLRLAELNRGGGGQGVTVLDHHKTAREALEGLQAPGLEIVFDMEKSGAVLAWEHFHPGEPVPLLLQYVQDRDLWTWKLHRSREFSAALSVEPRDFLRWQQIDDLSRFLNPPGSLEGYGPFFHRGEAILVAKNQHVESLASHAYFAEIEAGGDTYWVPAVNSPLFQSEIGERLCQLYSESPFSAVFFLTQNEEVWSLRSKGEFDVSAVAKVLGGGGHRNAAGFKRKRQ